MSYEPSYAMVNVEKFTQYSKKEMHFLFQFIKSMPKDTIAIFMTKKFRVELMVELGIRSESYLYRLLSPFIRRGDIYSPKKGTYLINPKFLYKGSQLEIKQAIAHYDSCVFSENIII